MGYSEDGLRGGEGETLVEQLDHKTLAYRVLSSWNLRDLTTGDLTTGWTLAYRPEDTPLKRQTPVKTWRQRLKSGELLARISAVRREADRGGAKPAVPPEL
jgi:hypothetical protein